MAPTLVPDMWGSSKGLIACTNNTLDLLGDPCKFLRPNILTGGAKILFLADVLYQNVTSCYDYLRDVVRNPFTNFIVGAASTGVETSSTSVETPSTDVGSESTIENTAGTVITTVPTLLVQFTNSLNMTNY